MAESNINFGAAQNDAAQVAEEKKEYFKKVTDEKGVTKLVLADDVRKQIEDKARQIMQQQNLKKVFPVVVMGEEGDSKPLYVAYFKRPDMATYARFMATVQNDEVQASMILAQNTIIDGDAELVNDEDLFVFGTMNQLTPIVQSRSGEVVKLQSVGK